MRRFLGLVLLAGCSEHEDRLDSFLARAEIECARYTCCPYGECPVPDPAPEAALACMNDALASGARAHVSFGGWSGAPYSDGTHVFTVDHQVIAFTWWTSQATLEKEYSEGPACTGPFDLGDQFCRGGARLLTWTGCP